MKLNIGEKEYTLEYTFEAVASEECIKKTLDLFSNLENEEMEIGEKMSSLPNTVITLFYCGLLENHSDEVLNRTFARALLKQYFKENKEDENATFYGVMMQIVEQMGIDGFFKQIGLTEESPKKEPKTPQDHKKKTTKKTQA